MIRAESLSGDFVMDPASDPTTTFNDGRFYPGLYFEGSRTWRVLEYMPFITPAGAKTRAQEILDAGFSAATYYTENYRLNSKEPLSMETPDQNRLKEEWPNEHNHCLECDTPNCGGDCQPKPKSKLAEAIAVFDRAEDERVAAKAAVVPVEMPTLQPGKYMHLYRCKAAPAFDPEKPDETFQHMLDVRGSYQKAHEAIREMMFISHGSSYMKGWWHDKSTGELLDQAYQVPIKLALIHSEVSEALEADRKGWVDDKLLTRPGIEVELADALHRILDLAGALKADLAGAYVEKCKFNAVRPDHSVENRTAVGRKAY